MKDLLENYMEYKAEIKSIEYKIRTLELQEVSVSGSNFEVNGDIRPKGFMTSNLENKTIKKVDNLDLLNKKKNELEAKIEMIDSFINTMSDYHRQIIHLRYMDKKTNSQIATEMKREERSIRDAMTKILNILEEKYSKFLKNSLKFPI